MVNFKSSRKIFIKIRARANCLRICHTVFSLKEEKKKFSIFCFAYGNMYRQKSREETGLRAPPFSSAIVPVYASSHHFASEPRSFFSNLYIYIYTYTFYTKYKNFTFFRFAVYRLLVFLYILYEHIYYTVLHSDSAIRSNRGRKNIFFYFTASRPSDREKM